MRTNHEEGPKKTWERRNGNPVPPGSKGIKHPHPIHILSRQTYTLPDALQAWTHT